MVSSSVWIEALTKEFKERKRLMADEIAEILNKYLERSIPGFDAVTRARAAGMNLIVVGKTPAKKGAKRIYELGVHIHDLTFDEDKAECSGCGIVGDAVQSNGIRVKGRRR